MYSDAAGMQCPHCQHSIPTMQEMDAAARYKVFHILDHAVRHVLGLGIYDMGDIDLDSNCDLDAVETWQDAAEQAKVCIRGRYGKGIMSMFRTTASFARRGILGRVDGTHYELEFERGDPVLQMLTWLDANFPDRNVPLKAMPKSQC